MDEKWTEKSSSQRIEKMWFSKFFPEYVVAKERENSIFFFYKVVNDVCFSEISDVVKRLMSFKITKYK